MRAGHLRFVCTSQHPKFPLPVRLVGGGKGDGWAWSLTPEKRGVLGISLSLLDPPVALFYHSSTDGRE
jgi:hypothetical protein